jgi:HPt (histidine-containing phosphotransfer) domain-containing protein
MYYSEARPPALGLLTTRPADQMSDNHEAGLRVLDVTRLHALGDDTGLGVRGVAALFLDQMGGQLSELRTAIDHRSAAAVAQMAHKCAGSSVLAGMERLSRLLRELEHSPDEGLGHPDTCIASLEREFDAVMTELSALVAAPGDAAASLES